jgi:hypothetical protein
VTGKFLERGAIIDTKKSEERMNARQKRLGGPRYHVRVTSNHNWVVCKVQDDTFVAHGGPRKLEEIINVFLSWTKQNAQLGT